MQVHTDAGQANHPPERIAELVWSTAPVLMRFMSEDISVFRRAVIRKVWKTAGDDGRPQWAPCRGNSRAISLPVRYEVPA